MLFPIAFLMYSVENTLCFIAIMPTHTPFEQQMPTVRALHVSVEFDWLLPGKWRELRVFVNLTNKTLNNENFTIFSFKILTKVWTLWTKNTETLNGRSFQQTSLQNKEYPIQTLVLQLWTVLPESLVWFMNYQDSLKLFDSLWLRILLINKE